MKIGLKKFVPVLMVGALGGGLLSGCIFSEDRNLSIDVASATGIVTGRVLDSQNRMHMGGATVTVIVNGSKRTTKTNNSNDHDVMGTFKIGGLPAGQHTMKIEMEGYATRYGSFYIDQSMDNTPVTTNIGNVAMNAGVDLNVVVTHDGVPMEGATVVAIYDDWSCDDESSPNWDDFDYFNVYDYHHEHTAMTMADGTAVLAGLDSCGSYNLFVPALDEDGDGVYEHWTSWSSWDGSQWDGTTVGIAMNDPGDPTDPVQAVGSNSYGAINISNNHLHMDDTIYANSGDNSDADYSIGPNDSLMLALKWPVREVGTTTRVWFVDDLRDLDANDDNAIDATALDDVEVAVTPTLDATGTLLTIPAPTGGWQINETYNFDVALLTNTGNTNNVMAGRFHIVDDTATGISATTVPTLDNYNGTSGDAAAGASAVYMELPEVASEIRFCVVSYTDNTVTPGVTTIMDCGGWSTITGGQQMVYNGGTTTATTPTTCLTGLCGNGQGVMVRTAIGASAADGDVARIKYEIVDMEGNRSEGEADITIQ